MEEPQRPRRVDDELRDAANVAEHLGIATAADIKAGRHPTTAQEAKRVRDWLDGCHIAWVECDTKQAAKDLETEMKRDHKPSLTKQ